MKEIGVAFACHSADTVLQPISLHPQKQLEFFATNTSKDPLVGAKTSTLTMDNRDPSRRPPFRGRTEPHGTAPVMVDLSLPCQAFMDAVHESWPSSQPDPAGRSGVACAIIVLRHLLSYFDPEDRQRFVDSLRLGRIPVLEQAVLHSDKDSLDSFFGKMKANLGADDLRFDKLMENSVMHDEIWDKQDFRLFLEVTYRASPDGPWGCPPHDLVLAGHDGLLHWDGYLLEYQQPQIHGDHTDEGLRQ
jgi:hypothetical protein